MRYGSRTGLRRKVRHRSINKERPIRDGNGMNVLRKVIEDLSYADFLSA